MNGHYPPVPYLGPDPSYWYSENILQLVILLIDPRSASHENRSSTSVSPIDLFGGRFENRSGRCLGGFTILKGHLYRRSTQDKQRLLMKCLVPVFAREPPVIDSANQSTLKSIWPDFGDFASVYCPSWDEMKRQSILVSHLCYNRIPLS